MIVVDVDHLRRERDRVRRYWDGYREGLRDAAPPGEARLALLRQARDKESQELLMLEEPR